MIRFSRRQLALYGAQSLLDAKTEALSQIAAYLVESHRTKEVSLLIRDIEKVLADKGFVYARVQTARVLDETESRAIEQMLTSRYGAEKVELSVVTTPNLLGGVVISAASDEYDGSLKRSITRLKALNV